MSIFNIELEKMANDSLDKLGFVATGDPAAAGGDPAAMGMDPAAMGGDPAAMGMDPAAMGMDPAAMGGDPAAMGMDPAAAAPPAGLTEDRVLQMIQEAGAGGAGGGSGADPAKKKVDVGTELYQIKKMLIYMLQAQGMSLPPDILLGDPAEDPNATPEQAASDPASADASPEAASSIQPIEPIGGAAPGLVPAAGGEASKQANERGIETGVAFAESGLPQMLNRASALQALINANVR